MAPLLLVGLLCCSPRAKWGVPLTGTTWKHHRVASTPHTFKHIEYHLGVIVMTLSRNQRFALRKVTATRLVPNRTAPIGNVSAYVQSAVADMALVPVTHVSPANTGRKVRFAGSFSPRTIVNDPTAMGYLTAKVNAEYDRTGRLPSVETVQGWV